jgi:uncharacterized protein
LFSHWEVPETVLRPLVPGALRLDAFEGRFFVGVVAFRMQRVRPYHWLPPLPTARDFGEINLRTYVHLDGGEPGVFFFSLDASSSLAVWAARTLWDLPYFRSDVTTRYGDREVEYALRRHASTLEFRASARLGEALPASTPDSLEYFLCERYQFYVQAGRSLRRARVHHRPYELFEVTQSAVDSTLLTAAGLPSAGTRTADFYSPGVDVDVFGLSNV